MFVLKDMNHGLHRNRPYKLLLFIYAHL